MRRSALVALPFSILLAALAPPASAAEPDAAARAANAQTAVQLAEEAADLFAAGKYADALDRYTRADALVKRHTIGVRIARCLAKLGRLNEAAERYLAVQRMPLPADLEPEKAAKQREAIAQAESERDALVPRIPAIIVKLSGPLEAAVTIDGQPLPAAVLGLKRLGDPGAHRVEARLGAEVVSREVVLREGEVQTVELTLQATSPPPIAPPPPQVAQPAPQLAPPPPIAPAPDRDDPARPRRIAGFVGIGVGAAGIAMGIVAGGIALGKKADLVTPCGPDLRCPRSGGESLIHQVETYNTLRGVSSLGFIAGGLLGAAGVVLVVTAPAPKSAVSIQLTPTGASVRGAF
jgi:hypothetical protein